MKHFLTLAACTSLLLPCSASAQNPLAEAFKGLTPDEKEYFQHVTTLSNPFFEGRAPGQRGNELAAEFVEFNFRKSGLTPAFPQARIEGEGMETGRTPFASFRQTFSTGRETVPVSQVLAFTAGGKTTELVADIDFAVRGISGNGQVSGPVVLVGYGITDGKDGYNSFAGLPDGSDLSGKVAMLFRYEPLNESGRSRWSDDGAFSSRKYTIAARLRATAERNPAAILLVAPPGVDDAAAVGVQNTKSTTQGTMMKVPVINLESGAAIRMVAAAGADLVQLRKSIDSSPAVTEIGGLSVSIDATLERRPNRTDNVGAVLTGRGALKDDYLVIGAHIDHVGFGFFGSRSNQRGVLHPGADDNASGTAGLLMLARHLAAVYAALPPDASARSIMFVGFNAEEGGLIGSRYFVNNSPLEADRIYAMLNLDMIGRARSDSQGRPKCEVAGVATAKGFEQLLRPLFDDSGMSIKTLPGGQGPSDHASFYKGNIPVLHIFTGLHDQYHTPADTYDLVNPRGAVKIVELAGRIARMLASRTEPLEFTPTRGGDIDYSYPTDDLPVVKPAPTQNSSDELGNARDAARAAREAAAKAPATPPAAERARRARPVANPAQEGGSDEQAAPTRSGMRVRFGIAPGDYEEAAGGLIVAEVFEGTSAAEAGLKAGDVITRWNDTNIVSVRDWMPLLMAANPGDKVKLSVKRGGETLVVDCILKGRD